MSKKWTFSVIQIPSSSILTIGTYMKFTKKIPPGLSLGRAPTWKDWLGGVWPRERTRNWTSMWVFRPTGGVCAPGFRLWTGCSPLGWISAWTADSRGWWVVGLESMLVRNFYRVDKSHWRVVNSNLLRIWRNQRPVDSTSLALMRQDSGKSLTLLKLRDWSSLKRNSEIVSFSFFVFGYLTLLTHFCSKYWT